MGPVNSARDPLKKQKNALLFLHGTHSARSQKKRKHQNANVAFIISIQTDTN